ncbi:hypothetical protein ACVWZ3_000379 [Bradyrhizobium sp. i1.3.6]
MPAERLPMRKIREVLRLKYACGVSDRVISRSVGIGRTAIAEYVRRAGGDRHHLADTGGARRHSTGAQAVCASRLQPAAIEAASGLGACPCRVAPPQRNAGAAVGGIPRPSSRRLRLQPVLRPLRRMAPRHHGDHAADPRGRRKAVRGLRRRYRAGVRRAYRGGARRQDLRRGHGSVELHIRPSPVQRGAARLDRRPCGCAHLPGRSAEGARLRTI